MNGNVIRTITIRGTSEGLDKLEGDLKKVAAAQENVAIVSEKSAKGVISLQDAWRKQTLKLDEAARAQANIARETRIADAAQREGLATQAQHAQRLEQINQRYNTVSQATQKFTQQTGLARHELINLGRQAQDVGVSLVSGQSPLMVLVQQGSQIADVFISSGRSVGSFFSQAAGWAARFVMSAGGVATAVIGIGAAALYMASSFASAQREIDKVLAGAGGAASGATRSGINRIAEGAAGGGMSIAEAREAALEFAKTGKIYEANILSATKLTRDFALAMGVDTADAAKQLAAALVDPSKGALDLNNSIRFLDVTTLAHIRTLQIHGDLQGAQKALMDAASAAAKRQADNVSALTSVYQRATAAVSDFMERRKKEIGGPSDEDQLKAARQNLQGAQGALGNAQDLGLGPRSMKALEDAASAAAKEVERLEQKLRDAAKATEDARFLKLSEDARNFSRELIPAIEQVDKLTTAIAKMNEVQAGRAARGMGPDANLTAATAVAEKNLAIAKETIEVEQRKAEVFLRNAAANRSVSATTAQTLAQLRDQLNVASAIGVTAKINAQYDATINDLLREGKSLGDAIAIAEAQRAIKLAEIESAHQVTMVSLRGQLAVAQEVTGLGQINAQHQANINDLMLQGLNLAQATEQADMRRAIALAQVNAEADRQLKTLKQEGELIDANDDRTKAAIKWRHTYNNLIEKGVEASKAQAVADQEHINALKEIEKAEARAAEAAKRAIANIKDAADAWKLYTDGVISWSVANDEAGNATRRLAAAADDAAYSVRALSSSMFSAGQEALNLETKFVPLATRWAGMAPLALTTYGGQRDAEGRLTQFDPGGYTLERYSQAANTAQAHPEVYDDMFGAGNWKVVGGKLDVDLTKAAAHNAQIAKDNAGKLETRLTDTARLTIDQSLASGGVEGTIQGVLAGSVGPIMGQMAQQYLQSLNAMLPQDRRDAVIRQELETIRQQPVTIEREQLIQQLTQSLDSLKTSVDSLSDVFSPFYSSDPRSSKLGFRTFAGGGIMTAMGELPLRQYQGGGMATSPQVAVFGEGSTPEAYVPVPSGRIPVEIKMPANSNVRPVQVVINVQGNADANTVSALKQTGYQAAQAMRRTMASGR